MYSIGDLIIYGSTGVCEIVGITKLQGIKGADNDKEYYVINPIFQGGSIYIPVDNTKVFMRLIITKEQAERLIDSIPNIQAKAYHDQSIQKLSEHYELALQTHNCADLIELTMSIYNKKQFLEQQKKKFGKVDERFMKIAEEMLYGELSVALDIPKEKVQEYIALRVKDIKKGRIL